jgi:hypothetical protein
LIKTDITPLRNQTDVYYKEACGRNKDADWRVLAASKNNKNS